MKTLLLWLALVVVGIGAALFFGRSRVETGTANRTWPLGLGVVADAPKRFPATKDNAAATKLIELAADAEIDLRPSRARRGGLSSDLREALVEYVRVQLERSGDTIDAPTADVARYLTENATALDEIQKHALSGAPIVFESDIARRPDREAPPGPNLTALQHLHRAFIAHALGHARTGSAEGWDDLHAAWELARPLWQRPEPMAILTASTSTRMVNGAARKMPLPPPAWFQELSSYGYERALAAAYQAEAWGEKNPAFTERLRGMADEVLRAKACDTASPQFQAVREKLGARAAPNLIATWERLMRFRAEREATQRVLQIRSGQAPSRDTQCSDGSWEVTPTSFEFNRDIAVPEPQIDYPLEYAKASP